MQPNKNIKTNKNVFFNSICNFSLIILARFSPFLDKQKQKKITFNTRASRNHLICFADLLGAVDFSLRSAVLYDSETHISPNIINCYR